MENGSLSNMRKLRVKLVISEFQIFDTKFPNFGVSNKNLISRSADAAKSIALKILVLLHCTDHKQ